MDEVGLLKERRDYQVVIDAPIWCKMSQVRIRVWQVGDWKYIFVNPAVNGYFCFESGKDKEEEEEGWLLPRFDQRYGRSCTDKVWVRKAISLSKIAKTKLNETHAIFILNYIRKTIYKISNQLYE